MPCAAVRRKPKPGHRRLAAGHGRRQPTQVAQPGDGTRTVPAEQFTIDQAHLRTRAQRACRKPLGRGDRVALDDVLRQQKVMETNIADLIIGLEDATNVFGSEFESMKSYTAYDFGYLYTVSDLFWWQREEEQIRQDKFGPFFMNPWDLLKIAGMKK